MEAVNSVFDSTWRPLEVILVDDGSTDETYENLVNLTPPAGVHYRILRQSNCGASAARNRGTLASKGRYIQFLDSDDMLVANKFAEQVPFLESNKMDVIYGDWWQGRSWHDKRYFKGYEPDALLCDLLAGRWMPNFSFLYRREAVERIGGWDETLGLNDDFDFAIRIAESISRISYCPKITGLYRWHPGERLSRKSRQAIARANLEILAKIEGKHELLSAGSLQESKASLQSCLANAYYRSAVGLSTRDLYAEECRQRAENLAPDKSFLPACCRCIAKVSLKSAYDLDYSLFSLRSGLRSIVRWIYRSLRSKIM